MRAPAIPPAEIGADLQPLYDDMRQDIEHSLKGFVAIRPDEALVRPWTPWLRHAKFGKPIWELGKALATAPSLPAAVREVAILAILVTGTHFRSGYELYAHVIVAEGHGLSDQQLETIVAGQRLSDLTREGGIAYDMAAALVSGGTLSELTWRSAVRTFGEAGAAELSYLVGLYCMVSVTLKAFDVPIPENAE